ncbi:MAG TPA: antitoxin Xre/MbcA/ParS toxin-binding domain-containing protein, partial [Puia sp.]|nr:antitoxin Xre/MbcA/ParS toxin-binding domain-containing protein [Puia sp.]
MAKAMPTGRKTAYRKTSKVVQSVSEDKASYTTGVATLTPIEKMQMAQKGVSKIYLEKFKDLADLDYQKLATALAVTRATLINKKKQEKFNPSLSERIVGLADLYDYGFKVFEDKEKFNRWMVAPNKALGGKAPFDIINSQFGREEI